MHALIRHYHAFSLLRRAIRPSLPSIICSFIMHPIPSAGSSKASSQLHSDCLAPSGSSLISIPLLLFLFIAFHFLFYIITYLFRVPQGVILSILLIYFNRYCSLRSQQPLIVILMRLICKNLPCIFFVGIFFVIFHEKEALLPDHQEVHQTLLPYQPLILLHPRSSFQGDTT